MQFTKLPAEIVLRIINLADDETRVMLIVALDKTKQYDQYDRKQIVRKAKLFEKYTDKNGQKYIPRHIIFQQYFSKSNMPFDEDWPNSEYIASPREVSTTRAERNQYHERNYMIMLVRTEKDISALLKNRFLTENERRIKLNNAFLKAEKDMKRYKSKITCGHFARSEPDKLSIACRNVSGTWLQTWLKSKLLAYPELKTEIEFIIKIIPEQPEMVDIFANELRSNSSFEFVQKVEDLYEKEHDESDDISAFLAKAENIHPVQ